MARYGPVAKENPNTRYVVLDKFSDARKYPESMVFTQLDLNEQESWDTLHVRFGKAFDKIVFDWETLKWIKPNLLFGPEIEDKFQFGNIKQLLKSGGRCIWNWSGRFEEESRGWP